MVCSRSCRDSLAVMASAVRLPQALAEQALGPAEGGQFSGTCFPHWSLRVVDLQIVRVGPGPHSGSQKGPFRPIAQPCLCSLSCARHRGPLWGRDAVTNAKTSLLESSSQLRPLCELS